MQNFQNPQDLKKRLDAKNLNDVLLDVRTPAEFDAGHIEGAVNFNISTLSLIKNIQKLDKTKTYILYCHSGSRSQMASMLMNKNGLEVINCQFGLIHLASSGIKFSN
jgi:rhodanese-related sulfurtransferase